MRTGRIALFTAATLVLTCSIAQAQVATATLKGRISADAAPAPAGTEVIATNTANGFVYKARTKGDGSYTLAGLAPGSYQITVAGAGSAQAVTLSVGETASVDFATGAAAEEPITEVTVTGSILRKDVKTSEVGTAISQDLIENLPQASRNLLAFADLAPGVRFVTAANTGQVKLVGGAQNQDNVNIFIDGVGQKNYVLRGGIAGMDATRGNPFPQSAISEYRVITQNYKAEYDQVSSAAITAVTRSGTNEFSGDVFFDRIDDAWVANDPFQSKAEAAGIERPPFHQDQFGFSLGGPIMKDKLFFFLAYEGKNIVAPRQVVLQNDNLLPDAGIVPQLRALQGSADSKFEENLVLAKIDAQLAEAHKLEFTSRIRRESDFTPEDTLLSVKGNEKDRTNDETRFDLKLASTFGSWLNEARIGHQNTVWNPHSKSDEPKIKYLVSPSNTPNNVLPVIQLGGSPDSQNRGQKGWMFQNDLTFTGLTGHTIKMGVKASFLKFDLSGTAFSVPYFELLIDNTTGEVIDPPLRADLALPGAAVGISDNQYGIYFQDDWEVTERLELNLGIRWDYETNMLNDSYVTPAERVAALLAPDVTRYGITPPAGQTYAESLALGGVTIEDYIADGNSRKAFKKAFQPRIGFSYDLTGDKSTVLFGGAGRAFDRTMANNALDELQKNQQLNGEIWAIKNDHKNPYTDQFSLGVRQAVGEWDGELGVIAAFGRHQFNWYGGNRDPNGGWANVSPIDPLFAGPHVVGGPPEQFYGTLVLGDFITKTMTKSAYVKADRPFSREQGWGVTATYTYTDGKTTNRQWNTDIFNWTYGKPGQDGYNPSVDVEKHRLVLTGITSKLPFGLLLAGKATLSSGLPYQLTDCSLGFSLCVYGAHRGDRFKQLDLALSKNLDLRFTRMNVRADVLNILNTVNYGGYDAFGGGPGNPQNELGGDNPNFGTPNGMYGPMRTLKLTFSASF